LLVVTALLLGQVDAPAKPADPAAAEAARALQTKVLALVRQLDSSQQAKREEAEKALVELGGEVLPLLPDVNARTPAEVKNRLGRVRSALLKAAIEAATKPALVTLSGELPVSQAFAEIAQQTGNKFVDYRERFNQEQPDPKIKVSLDKVPFWEALDTVLDAGNLSLYNFDEEAGALAYTSRGEGIPPRAGRASYSGIFRLEPTRVEAVRDLRNPANRSLKVSIDVAWEPRVRPIVLEQPLDQVKASDENGDPIEVDGREGNLEVPVEASNSAVELDIPLVAPSRDVKQIASLTGKLTAVVLGRVEAFEFTNLDTARAVEQERGGVTVVLEQCRKNGDIYDVSMRVRFDKAANALESHRGWIYNNECYLVNAKGNRIENAGLEANLLAANEVGLSYKFDLGENVLPTGCKFVYKTPAAILKIPVEFEVKNIDLP
jgi:hypothetical protein